MKQLILILSMLLSFTSCSETVNPKEQDTSIVGTWQLIEVYGSDGGSNPQWTPVEDGYTYTFKSDSTFSSNRFNECEIGTYSTNQDQLTLNYSCDGFTTGIEGSEGTFVENFKIENSLMFLSPTYMSCIEGCDNKFKKIGNIE